jgi:hypothetical protein
MRAANSFSGSAAEKPRIALAPHKGPRSLIERGIRRAVLMGQSRKTRHIGVIHQYPAAEAIHFISPDCALRCGSACRRLHKSVALVIVSC